MTINFDANPVKVMIESFSKSLTYIPVTKTTDNIRGDETLTDGTSTTISGSFFRKEDAWSQNKEGLFQGADAIVMVLPAVTLSKNAKITYDSETYRIEKIITRRLGTITYYNMARLFKI